MFEGNNTEKANLKKIINIARWIIKRDYIFETRGQEKEYSDLKEELLEINI